ncbi:interferon gamma receptor 1 isoform X2 [Denticeps clupeoides]|uniref:Fibronectin type-III domain-containing protein n=1 Tax=Denticeps clupeoides TaxID=299321 RepID=A0AAY4AD29_9TELE|nr:interferon gamma receptor 1-like isoform X2 [Denticeps clupeoides]
MRPTVGGPASLAAALLVQVFWTALSSALPCPVNVTVNCDNFHTVVYWNYSHPLPSTLFNLRLLTHSRHSEEINTTETHCDTTSILKHANYAEYTVKIRAVGGDEVSAFSGSIVFTFNSNSINYNTLCKLDFPRVNLSLQHEHKRLKVTFQNPLRVYRNAPALKYLEDNEYPTFDTIDFNYKIKTNLSQTGLLEFSCKYAQMLCEALVPMSAGEEEHGCIEISGSIRGVLVRGSRVCLHGSTLSPQPPSSRQRRVISIIIICVPLAALVAITMAVIARSSRKSFIKSNAALPSFLSFFGSGLKPNGTVVHQPHKEETHCLTVEPHSVSTAEIIPETLCDDQDDGHDGIDSHNPPVPYTPTTDLYQYNSLSSEMYSASVSGHDRPPMPLLETVVRDSLDGYCTRAPII